MGIKDVIIIALVAVGIVCGAITGIVGGAGGMVAVATVIHNIVD